MNSSMKTWEDVLKNGTEKECQQCLYLSIQIFYKETDPKKRSYINMIGEKFYTRLHDEFKSPGVYNYIDVMLSVRKKLIEKGVIKK